MRKFLDTVTVKKDENGNPIPGTGKIKLFTDQQVESYRKTIPGFTNDYLEITDEMEVNPSIGDGEKVKRKYTKKS